MFKMAAQKHDKLKNAVYANMEKQSSMFERISRANMQFIQVKEDSVATRQREQIVNQINKSVLDFHDVHSKLKQGDSFYGDLRLRCDQLRQTVSGHVHGRALQVGFLVVTFCCCYFFFEWKRPTNTPVVSFTPISSTLPFFASRPTHAQIQIELPATRRREVLLNLQRRTETEAQVVADQQYAMRLNEPTIVRDPESTIPAAQPSAPAYTGSVSHGQVPPLRPRPHPVCPASTVAMTPLNRRPLLR